MSGGTSGGTSGGMSGGMSADQDASVHVRWGGGAEIEFNVEFQCRKTHDNCFIHPKLYAHMPHLTFFSNRAFFVSLLGYARERACAARGTILFGQRHSHKIPSSRGSAQIWREILKILVVTGFWRIC